jgi:glutamine synthetase
VALNTIVAESLDYIATALEKAGAGSPEKFNKAVQKILVEIAQEHSAVIFNGNGYAEEWHQEAETRGLPNLKTSVEALPVFGSEEIVSLFEKYNVLSRRELESRRDIYLEQYCKNINVESLLMIEIAKTLIFPAAVRYQGELAATCANLKLVGYNFDTNTLDKVTELVKCLQDSTADLERATAHNGGSSLLAEATHFRDEVLPAMAAVRQYADELEGIVADDLWPLPTYQEMLFIK